ncbi:wd40 repeat-containing protein [Leptolyngbya sp. Heron Island J]|uniref:AAA-like domain-containing protein n=1 Tax=Leptolyngbya sp. Heron Island J TaxID=1385935 RepID=UPI0003B93B99|nr:AAA-like domain-containing protein [Leptolyngbya sp. Heron Island J]ESA32793.1 wd40 repeat-containing protein [Leptolyngbya sp. Heron Island J]
MQYQMRYQIGGTLTNYDPTYVLRQADDVLYRQLQAGEFCYIFNTRQMGKSSLLVRTKKRLHHDGHQCLTLDMTNVGTEMITPQQWYKGILGELVSGLQAEQPFTFSMADLHTWWQGQGDIPLVQKLSRFLGDILLPQLSNQRLFIMVDEIDSVLALPFAVDDFFALVRYCYNQRALNSTFQRITFALFGVATPADLIQDKTRTPFNIGHAVTLHGFSLAEAAHLANGLAVGKREPKAVLQAILHWTGGQPFLTQKLCQLVTTVNQNENDASSSLTDADWVAQIVQSRIIDHWESQDEPEHLRTIRDRILRNEPRAGRLLGLQQKLLAGDLVPSDDSLEQTELLLSGLVIQQQNTLQIRNPIYQAVFDQAWVSTQLANLRPYSQALQSWSNSGQHDSSRLLRGQALQDAQQWATDKSLGDFDYQFLRASEALDRKEAQQQLELARAQEVEARLQQEQRASKLQRYLLGAVSVALVGAIGLSVAAFWQYRRALHNENQARLSEVEALMSAAQSSLASQQTLDAIVVSVKTKQRLNTLNETPPSALVNQVDITLKRSLYASQEINRFSGSNTGLWGIDWSPDGESLVTIGGTNEVHRWQRDGTLMWSITDSDVSPNVKIKMSPDGRIAVGGQDSHIRIYDPNGQQQTTWEGHSAELFSVDWSADGDYLASGSADGTHVTTLTGHTNRATSIAFSPDGQQLASGSSDRTINLWNYPTGTLQKTLKGHTSTILSLHFTPDSQTLVAGSIKGNLSFWSRDGEPLKMVDQGAGILGLDLSPDGQQFAIAQQNNQVAIKQLDDTPVSALDASSVIAIFSPNSQTLATANWDGTVQLWQPDGSLLHTLSGHEGEVYSVDFHPDGQLIASASSDQTVRLWSIDGTLLTTLYGHTASSHVVSFSPDGMFLVSGGDDQNTIVWHLDKIMELDDTIFACGLIADYLRTSPNIAENDRTICN